jgi:hypothetical protein
MSQPSPKTKARPAPSGKPKTKTAPAPRPSPPPPRVNATRYIWIPPHSCFTRSIQLLDLTPQDLPFSQDEDRDYDIARDGAASSTSAPLWTLRKTGILKHFLVYEGDPPERDGDTGGDADGGQDSGAVAVWHQARWEWGTAEVSFPRPGGDYPTHPVTMRHQKKGNIFSRSEVFVYDSAEYVWRFDSRWTKCRLALFKRTAGGEVVVARYRGRFPVVTAAGCLKVDEGEVNVLLAALTCATMLRKELQRR